MVKNEWARCNDHCPVWEKLDCKSYLVVTKEKNYNAAKADCVSMGAKLVEPKDKKVNDFVASIAGEDGISGKKKLQNMYTIIPTLTLNSQDFGLAFMIKLGKGNFLMKVMVNRLFGKIG